MRSGAPTEGDEGRGRRGRVAAGASLVAIFVGLTVVYPWWNGRRADHDLDGLYRSLSTTYGGTTSQDIDGLFVESFSPGDGGRFEDFFARAPGLKPYRITAVDDGRGYQARYGVTRSGQRRCVVATWRIDSLTLDRSAGAACDAGPGAPARE